MNAIRRIRTEVFGISQIEMARIARVRQATISRWEHEVNHPSLAHLNRIRAEAARRKLPWDDGWLFGERAA